MTEAQINMHKNNERIPIHYITLLTLFSHHFLTEFSPKYVKSSVICYSYTQVKKTFFIVVYVNISFEL